jgi:hypothetical protein
MKPYFIIEKTPVYSGYFLSPEEHRKRNTEARRAKRIKLSPEEAAHERVIDRERWALCRSRANKARCKNKVVLSILKVLQLRVKQLIVQMNRPFVRAFIS